LNLGNLDLFSPPPRLASSDAGAGISSLGFSISAAPGGAPLYICREPSTNTGLFMQNKPNFHNTKMNLTIYYTKVYNNEATFRRPKNKPNQTQNKPNLLDAQMNVNIYYTYVYSNQTPFRRAKNKPNSNPNKANFPAENAGRTESKDICLSNCPIKKYALYPFSPRSLRTRRLMKNKPSQTQFMLSLPALRKAEALSLFQTRSPDPYGRASWNLRTADQTKPVSNVTSLKWVIRRVFRLKILLPPAKFLIVVTSEDAGLRAQIAPVLLRYWRSVAKYET